MFHIQRTRLGMIGEKIKLVFIRFSLCTNTILIFNIVMILLRFFFYSFLLGHWGP